jgi:hypothetical protein
MSRRGRIPLIRNEGPGGIPPGPLRGVDVASTYGIVTEVSFENSLSRPFALTAVVEK